MEHIGLVERQWQGKRERIIGLGPPLPFPRFPVFPPLAVVAFLPIVHRLSQDPG